MNKKSSKLLAAVAVFAMVFAVFAAVPIISDGSATSTEPSSPAAGEVTIGTGDDANIAHVVDQAGIQKFIANAGGAYDAVTILWITATSNTLSITADITLDVPVVIKNTAATTIDVAKGKKLAIDVDAPGTNGVFAALDYPGTTDLSITGEGTIDIDVGGTMKINTKNNDFAYGIKTGGKLIMSIDNINVDMNAEKAAGSDETIAEGFDGIRAVGFDLGDSTDGSKVSINASGNNTSFGITATSVMTLTKVSGEIYGQNRAIHLASFSTLGFTDCTGLVLKGGEKAIQDKYGGAITLESSTIDLQLTEESYNSGNDDRFGLKLNANLTLDASSTLTTAGLRVMSGTLSNSGIVKISGDYIQNPDADIKVKIAGLYADSAAVEVVKVASAADATAKTKYYLIGNAETYGAGITVKDASGNDVQKTATTGSEANTALSSADVVVLNASTGWDGEIEVKDNKTLQLNSTTGVKGTIKTLQTEASGSNAAVYNRIIMSDDFVGSLIIEKGSITIQGTISSGTITIEGEIKLSGTLEIGSSGKLVIDQDSVLNLNENTLTADGLAAGTAGVEGNVVFNNTSGHEAKMTGNGRLVIANISSEASASAFWADGLTANITGNIVFNDTVNYGMITVENGTISGTFNEGTLVISKNVAIKTSSTLTIGEKARVIIKESSKLDAAGLSLENDGIMQVYGALIGTDVTNDGTIILMSEDAYIPEVMKGTGSVDTDAIQSDITLSGDMRTATYGINQTVTLTGTTTVKAGSLVTIKGVLIVEDGVTLTIEDGAQLHIFGSTAKLINYGTIVVASDVTASDKYYKDAAGTVAEKFVKVGGLVIESSAMENNGVLNLSYEQSADETNTIMNIIAGKVDNNGQLNVDESNILASTGTLNNNANGITVVYGTVTGSILNYGTVTVDGAVSAISIRSVTAVVDVVSTSVELTIDDAGLKTAQMSATSIAKTNSIKLTPNTADKQIVGGLTVSVTVTKIVDSDPVNYEKNLIIDGSIAASKTSESAVSESVAEADVALTGTNVIVSGEFVLAEGVDIISGTKLKVTGQMSTVKNNVVKITNIVVEGSMTLVGKNAEATVAGAMYSIRTTGTSSITTYYWSNLATAIEGAKAASIAAVELYGDMKVSEDLAISGITLKQKTGTITVDAGAAINVATDGKLEQTSGAKVIVNGTLYAADKKTGIGKGASITSDVISEGEKDIRYTSLSGAIAAAGSAEATIKLTNDKVIIENGLVIPENITVDTNGKEFIVKGCKLSVEGTLYLNGGSYAVQDVTTTSGHTTKGEVSVTGFIRSAGVMTFDAVKYPAGVYFTSNLDSYITSLDNLAVAIEASDDSKVKVYGQVSAGDLQVTGTATEPAVVEVMGDTVSGVETAGFTAGTITLSYATISFKVGKTITATIAGPTGSVKVVDAAIAASKELSFIASEDADKVTTFTVTGAVEGKKSADATKTVNSFALIVSDIVSVKDLAVTAADKANTVSGKTPYPVVVEGTLIVIKGAATTDLGNVVVNGTLTVDNGASASIDNVVVMGTFQALEATTTEFAGTITGIDSMYVGVSVEATTGAAATVTGSITTDSTAVIYVAKGAAVPEKLLEGLKSINFHVEDAVWMTVYGKGDAKATVSDIPVENVAFLGWSKTADLKTVENNEKTGSEYKIITEFTIDGTITDLYAKIDYNVYFVKVVTDNGIASVAIDGVLLETGAGQNAFTNNIGLKAGQHTLTYTLKSGYEGTAVMYIDGKAVSGYTIETTGDINDVLVIDLKGTTAATGKSTDSSGMSLTEILLIVLVVLIAVMAIVIAMRMMRS